MLKIMTIVGTRPELIKMSRVIAEFDKHVNHILVHTGQNYDYELNQVFFEDLEIRKPNYFLDVATGTVSGTIARIIEKADEILQIEQPDALLLYGDTNSCLSVLVAKRRKIPVFHMEAGNRCFDQNVPEELNRKVIDHLSDINLVLTEHARRYLISEGIRPETVFKTGSHMHEVLNYYEHKISNSSILSLLQLVKNSYFIVSIHREENVDSESNLLLLLNTLNKLANQYDVPVIVSTHPRTQKRLDNLKNYELDKRVRFLKPFGFSDYVCLQKNALCVLSDSGTITEESSLLNFRAITVRNVHERPEGMDAGILIMSGLDPENVLRAVDVTINMDLIRNNPSNVEDYINPAASHQILKIVLSYIPYVNRLVWNK
ncbi:UDP-N-acetylglucosamine 2-epimerase (non-hydrolyzing) [Leeia sp. TBRC 13508]|uniref:UDP-N-acetylglucosamine 2-epimerase (Non-hydrolyzing) n=1 Tax=Leeia speluncae TaxID=2884804 RepID=A0ABS8D486_9NEIS|nr:UDP-N-acetylglucosamine 2-epimerase (non-hydrolyzing) [Leeia speluncae]MCB6182786.1 UDP-N-acetylglucosamine 2-epimerase (non-hydrolyzing) [Leeia speluncae]